MNESNSKIGIRRPQGNPPAGFPTPLARGVYPPYNCRARCSALSNIKFISDFMFPPTKDKGPPTQETEHKIPREVWGEMGGSILSVLKLFDVFERARIFKISSHPPPPPPQWPRFQGPAPVAIPTETSIANFLNVSYGRPYHPCVGAPEATASCGLWGCLIPSGGDH